MLMRQKMIPEIPGKTDHSLETVLFCLIGSAVSVFLMISHSSDSATLFTNIFLATPLIVWGAVRLGWHAVFWFLTGLFALLFYATESQLYHPESATSLNFRNLYILQNVLAYSALAVIMLTTGLKKARQSHIKGFQSLEKYLLLSSDVLFKTDASGLVIKAHKSENVFAGLSNAHFVNKNLLDFIHPDDVEKTEQALTQVREQKFIANLVNRIASKDDEGWRWFQWNLSYDNEHIAASGRDISEQKQNEENLRLASLVYHNSKEAMMVTDENNLIVSINPAFTACTGYTAEEIIGKNPRVLSSGRQEPAFYKAMWHAINTTGQWQGEIFNRRKNSEIYVEWVIINSVFKDDGTVYRRIAQFTDLTEQKTSEETIWFQANFDPLTHLPNRRLFLDRLQQELKKAKRDQYSLALLFIDLDRFKEVNDSLGHSTGDNLLIQVASRLKECVRQSDTVARLGGDEFTVIIAELHDTTDVEKIAGNILLALEQPFVLGESIAYVSASIGITLSPEDSDYFEDLVRYADQAMYSAKNEGRNGFRFFTPDMQRMMEQHIQVAHDLRDALQHQQFQAFFQPIVALDSRKIVKAEALIRWQHPERGLIFPDEFIPVAEETGMINDIGDWMFEQAVDVLSNWQQKYAVDLQISINKSPAQFNTQEKVHSHWIDKLRERGLSGNSVVVEITEGLLLDAKEQVEQKLDFFRDHAMQLAIDDFGTGYSALAYLKNFQIDFLKIDRSFTRNLASNSSEMSLCEAIIAMAHKLDIKVIAEGIETPEQCDLLLNAGCDYGQGYLFGKPVSAEVFETTFLNGLERSALS